jgi:hypothetical protein
MNSQQIDLYETSGSSPPQYDPDVERRLLGTLALHPGTWDQAHDALRPEDFYLIVHQRIFSTMRDPGPEIDAITLDARLKDCVEYQEVSGLAYLTRILSNGDLSTIEQDTSVVLAYARQRKAMLLWAPQVARTGADLEALRCIAGEIIEYVDDRCKPKQVDEYNTAALFALDDSGDQYLVDGVLQDAGLNILMAEGGIGKSVAAMDLAIRTIAGGSAFGGLVSRQGGVLYLGADVDTKTMRRRLVRLCVGAGITDPNDLPGFKYIRAPLDFGDPATFAFIQHKADEVAREHSAEHCALIVVDSLTSYMYALDENSAGDTGLVMNQLRLLSERTGASVLILHHVNKNELATGSNRGRGSTALPNAADCVLHMTRKAGTIILNQTKNRNAPLMAALTYEITDGDDNSLVATFLPASAADVGEVMVDLCLDEMARLAKASAGEALGKRELYLALDAVGHFTFRTKERAWACLKLVPGYIVGKNGRSMSVVYHDPSQPLPIMHASQPLIEGVGMAGMYSGDGAESMPNTCQIHAKPDLGLADVADVGGAL